jgi:hypothetical protein
MSKNLEPNLSENAQPRDSSELNSKIHVQKPIKEILAAIVTLGKTKKLKVFAIGVAIILLNGFWPTGQSDKLGGRMSLRCGRLHWNQKVVFEGITFNCSIIESNIENRNDYWIEVSTIKKGGEKIYDIVAPRSSVYLGNNFFFPNSWVIGLTDRFDINVTKIIDQEKPIQHSINPNHKESSRQQIWGYNFRVLERDNQRYISISKDSFSLYGSNYPIDVTLESIENGQTGRRTYFIDNRKDDGYLIPIKSGPEINRNAPIIIDLQTSSTYPL